ncbi:MAG: YebB family permuted papain-like enzyme [Proteobacteria bacterium]|nr:YebB family permuted papain-like enzyme [Pseudomonadota bacterium]
MPALPSLLTRVLLVAAALGPCLAAAAAPLPSPALTPLPAVPASLAVPAVPTSLAVPAVPASAPVLPPLAVGDLVFIRVPWRPFVEVAAATGSWTNHVGIVVDTGGPEPLVAESTFPLARATPLSRFVARSEGARVAVRRLAQPLDEAQAARLKAAAQARYGALYDTGFDLRSPRRQFCSRFVHEVLLQATGATVGEVERFETLLRRRPDANLGFWRLWYFGRIPWQRQTVTPASVLASPLLRPVFDGRWQRS